MTVIDHLSYGSQLRRFRELGEAALTHYDLGNARLSLLSHHKDVLFRVVATPVVRRPVIETEYIYSDEMDEEEEHGGNLDGESPSLMPRTAVVTDLSERIERKPRSRYVLRLYSEQGSTAAQILSELQWLRSLCRDSNLGVPDPVPNRSGALITDVAVEGIPEVRRCVVTRWVEGRFVDTSLSPTHLERIGAFMARMHLNARSFIPPAGFERPRWELESLLKTPIMHTPSASKHTEQKLYTAAEQKLFRQAVAWGSEGVQILPQDGEHYGLIHYDLRPDNYLFYKEEPRAIDFEECCCGPYLMDIAVTLTSIVDRPQAEEMHTAFFRGYESIKPLSDAAKEAMPRFMALGLAKLAGTLPGSGLPAEREKLAAWLSSALRYIHTLLD